MPQIKLLKILIFGLLLVFLATFLAHKINLPTDDLGRHIKMGEIIWQTKSVPKVNLFSYAEPDHRFINHHWLSEVFFYGLFNAVGFGGLVIFKLIILLLAFSLVYWLVIKRAGFGWATVFGFLALLVFVERTDVRPEIFSYLFTAIYLWIFYLYQQGKRQIIWWLIPLQLLWVNLHIYFFIGIFLAVIFIASQIKWKKLVGYLKIKPWLEENKSLFFLLLLIGLVLFVNPNFYRGAFYPLNVLKNYGYDIVENKSPFYLDNLMNDPLINYFKILIVLVAAGLVFNHRRINFFDFIIAAAAIFLGWFALRNFPLSALLAWPVVAVGFSQSFGNLIKWLKLKTAEWFDYLKAAGLILILIFLLIQIYLNLVGKSPIIQAKHKEVGVGLSQQSSAAAEFFLQNNLTGPVFNNFDIGSYLDFYLYPNERTFVDNRPEAFSVEFWQYVYIPAQSSRDWWQVFNQHYRFNTVFFGHTDGTGWAKSFLKRIVQDPEWVTVYIDKHAIILVKNSEKNKDIIQRFAMANEEVSRRLANYRLTQKPDPKLEAQKLKGIKYIEEHFGKGIVAE